MSKKRKEILNEEVTEVVNEAVVENTTETTEIPDNVEVEKNICVLGVVVRCKKLNIRTRPDLNGKIIGTVDVGTELEINLNKSTKDWYAVTTKDGKKGCCMKKYIKF